MADIPSIALRAGVPVGYNPYVGPRSIKTGEAFWGRDREIRSLSALLLAERIVLLHSPSGAGKSSLIEAGLRPRMVERFHVSPLVRVNLEIPDELRGVGGLNRYLVSTLLSLEEAMPLEKRLPLTELTALSLDAYLEQRALPAEGPENSLLLFDQFEEVLTVSPSDAPAKQQFFEQLGEALQNRRRWALFAIREDYMGGLAPYVRAIPNRLSVTFRLGLLGVQAAKLAIQQPARDKGVDFTDAAAQKLVDDLCLMQVQQPDGSFISAAGPDVEPVQLQVVCYNLWQLPRADEKSISEDDVQRVGSVDQALASFYAERLRDISEKSQLDERILREWFNDHLITTEGIRSQVLKGAQSTAELPNSILSQLESAYLIRGETRAGKTWYELSHDRLVQPIRLDNTAWFEKNLSFFQRRAELWNQQGRSEGLLLRGKEFVEAEKEVATLQLPSDESDFLEACRKLHKHEQQNIRQKRAIFIGLLTSLIFFVLALWGFIYANQQTHAALTSATQAVDAQKISATNESSAKTAEAKAKSAEEHALEQAQIARAGELAANAVAARDKDFQLSLLLGIEAFHTVDTYQSRGVLLDNTQTNPQLRNFLSGYAATINSITFSPDRKMLASTSNDKTIILWNVAAGQQIGQPMKGHIAAPENAVFNLDGKMLASWNSEEIILWDVATQQKTGQPLETSYVSSVVFSPDGNTLASWRSDKIILWNIATHQQVGQPLKGTFFDITSIAFSPDSKTLVTGSCAKKEDIGFYHIIPGCLQGELILLDVATSQQIGQTIMAHVGDINELAFSPDSKTLATGSCAKKAKRDLGQISPPDCLQGELILWDVATGQQIGQPIRGHTSDINRLAFSTDGKTIASSSADKTIITWDVATHKMIDQSLDRTSETLYPGFSPDEVTTASISEDKTTIILRDNTIGQPIGQLLQAYGDRVSSVVFTPDGKILASGSVDSTITLLNVAAHKQIGQLMNTYTSYIWSVAFSPDGKTLASGSYDIHDKQTINLWAVSTLNTSMDTAQPMGQRLKTNTDNAYSVAFSPDSKMLASGGQDNTVILWDVATTKLIDPAFKGHTSDILSVAFSPDGKTLASGSRDHTIIIWNVASHEPIGQPLKGHIDGVYSVVFSPDGKMLASGSEDDTIIIWNVATHEPIGQPLRGHKGAIRSVAFNPFDIGKTLISSSEDSTIILWDVATHQPIGKPLKGYTGGTRSSVYSIAFSPNGKTLASGDGDGTIILWDLDPRTWVDKSCKRVGRNLTHAEWAQYGFTETYRATCPQYGLEAEPTPVPTP